MSEDRSIELAETFAEIAQILFAAEDVQSTLQAIVDLAAEMVDGCDSAGVSIVEGRTVTTPAASSDVPRAVDKIQYDVGEGPCLDAIRSKDDVFRTGDLGNEGRWPEFSPRAAAETGVHSMVGYQLSAADDTLGALNLYAMTRDAFDDAAVAIGSVFAAHAAVAMATARQAENLKSTLESRDVIGQAKGILMTREGMTADQAFTELRQASQRLNRKLRDVASEVARTGEVPEEPS
ncbi:MAG: two-component system response regulator [Actinomycetia bacterium]|nr:two-component system response regulator [Actinomycetes bacterium]